VADTNFIVKNTLVVNTAFVVNSTSLTYSGNNTFSGLTTINGVTTHNANLAINGVTTHNANLAINGVTTHNANLTIASNSGINANGSIGTAGQILTSNGTTVYWGAPVASVAGSNTQIQFNNSGSLAGAAGLTFNNTTNNVSAANALAVSGALTVGGIVNITGGGGGQALSLYSGGDFYLYSAGNTNVGVIYCDNANEIRTNGNSYVGGSMLVVGDVISNYSDNRLKDVSGPIPNALDKIKQLEGFYYTPNKQAINLGIENNQLQKVGVSAQQVQSVLPEVVKDSPAGDGFLTVQYEKLVPLLIEAIKELSAKVEKLGG
jgi:hypothetical protein